MNAETLSTQPSPEWRPIDGWPYEVSDHGQIRRVWKDKTKDLKIYLDRYGYPYVTLTKAGGAKTFKVHVLVLTAFHGPKPFPKLQGRHLDGNQRNNHKDNLMWGTKSRNERDKILHGTSNRGERNGRSLLSSIQVAFIRQQARRVTTGKVKFYKEMALKFGVKEITIRKIVSKKGRVHG